jgi:FkbM family methyltransferase
VATYDPYANMHEPSEAKVELFSKANYKVKGVVHVGANDGKELAWYVTQNYRPILAFEPHPDAFAELQKHYWNHALLWQIALGFENGTLKLNIPEDNDTEKSSKFKPIPTEGHDWTKTLITKSIEVPLSRFDAWAWKGGIDLTPFNTLVIDVQGMELEVLNGFGEYLRRYFDLLVVECSQKPVYDGEPSAEEVINWLQEREFRQWTPIQEHDDILFIHNRIYKENDSEN